MIVWKMAAAPLEKEDHGRDASFNRVLHGKSAQATGGVAAMFAKDKDAKKAAVDEYFKHFDNKKAANETSADREVRRAELECPFSTPPSPVRKLTESPASLESRSTQH